MIFSTFLNMFDSFHNKRVKKHFIGKGHTENKSDPMLMITEAGKWVHEESLCWSTFVYI